MSRRVAIVTGASQGIGRSTAIRLAQDFTAIVLVARNRENLDQTAVDVKKSGAGPLVIDLDLSHPDAAQKVVDQTLSAFGQIDALLNIAGAVPQIDVFAMTDDQWNPWPRTEAPRRAAIDGRGVAVVEGNVRVGGIHVGQFSPVSQSTLRGCGHDQRGHRGAGEGVLRPGYRRRCSGQQRVARPRDDGSAAILSGTLGTAAQPDCRRSDGEVSTRSGDRPLWHARGDCRADGVHRVAGGSLDDGLDAEDGRWRGQVDLNRTIRPSNWPSTAGPEADAQH